jgi:hypothetical protein
LLTLLAEAAGQTVDSKTRKVSAPTCAGLTRWLLAERRVITVTIIITLPAALMKIAN